VGILLNNNTDPFTNDENNRFWNFSGIPGLFGK
jgi:hypothetical protein